MHDDLEPLSQSTSQKFQKHSINFEKTQYFSKNPKKLGHMHEMHEEWVKRIIPDERRWSLGRKTLGKEVWSERERFWEVKSQQESREIERNEYDIARILYIEPLESRQIERCREVLRFKFRQMHLSSSYPEVSTAKRGSIDRGAIEHLLRR